MRKFENKKGFTLAELLIVVAIIAVLVAIAIPVFTTQLEKSREATDMANIRSAYSDCVVSYLTDASAHEITVPVQQRQAGWASGNGTIMVQKDGSQTPISITARTEGNYKVSIDTTGSVKVE